MGATWRLVPNTTMRIPDDGRRGFHGHFDFQGLSTMCVDHAEFDPDDTRHCSLLRELLLNARNFAAIHAVCNQERNAPGRYPGLSRPGQQRKCVGRPELWLNRPLYQ